MATTDYVILRTLTAEEDPSSFEHGQLWLEAERITAPSAEEAVRKLAQDGTFAPIPSRSWNIFTIESITEPRRKVTRLE
jgi:hypothetical protein